MVNKKRVKQVSALIGEVTPSRGLLNLVKGSVKLVYHSIKV